jgi:hypothetical protein
MKIHTQKQTRNSNIIAFNPANAESKTFRIIRALAVGSGLACEDESIHTENEISSFPHKQTVSNFNTGFPQEEQFPQKFEIEIIDFIQGEVARAKIFYNGKQIGNDLTDNSYDHDGYRFHDVFHLSYAAILSWSPVMRQFLDCKRKSNPRIDEVEDGGRAKVTEEAISIFIFSHAKKRNFWVGMSSIDHALLEEIQIMTENLEVSQCSTSDWETEVAPKNWTGS